MSDLLSMVSLRDRLKQLIMAPTVDKACSIFSTILLGTMFVTLVAPAFSLYEKVLLLIVQGVLFIGSTVSALLFKWGDQPARDRESARLKAEIDHDYLLKNPKLKETQITLDKLELLCDEMSILRQLVAAALNNKAVDKKYYDPNIVNETPWSKVNVSASESENPPTMGPEENTES